MIAKAGKPLQVGNSLRFQQMRLRDEEMEYVFQRQKAELGLSHSRKAHLLNASA